MNPIRSIKSFLQDHNFISKSGRGNSNIKAFFDSAKNSINNRRRWLRADQDAFNNPFNNQAERQILQKRSRYEVSNNSYAKGMVLTLANDVIGDAPRLQVVSKNPELNAQIESVWESWTTKTKLAKKLRAMRYSQTVDGEAFAMISRNPNLRHPIKLDLQLIDSALVTSPLTMTNPLGNTVDGIEFDIYGNPETYHVQQYNATSYEAMFKDISATDMIHIFRLDQVGQLRGVSEIAPSLEIFSVLRLFILSVLDSAQAAAALTGIASTDQGPDGDYDEMDEFFQWNMERNQVMFLPGGWKFNQLKSEQPVATFSEFVETVINIAARSLLIPYNVAAGNSSDFNFASGRLDHQAYHRMISIIRAEYEADVLDRIFDEWLNYFFTKYQTTNSDSVVDYRWHWKGFDHIDPKKAADADTVNLSNGTTTMAELCARQGFDYLDLIKQRTEERKIVWELENKLGLPHSELKDVAAPQENTENQETDEEESEVEKESARTE